MNKNIGILENNWPDPTITQQDMFDYGYTWSGMLPLRSTKAYEFWDSKSLQLYRLYEDGTEGAVENGHEEIAAHTSYGGIFGVELEDYLSLLK